MGKFSLRHFLLLKGRADRRTFLMILLGIYVLWQLPNFIVSQLLMRGVGVYAWQHTAAVLGLCLLAWPLFCVAARRLHDIKLPAWPAVIYGWHPFTVIMAVMNNQLGMPAHLPPGTSTAANMIILAVSMALCLVPGGGQDNRYGPPPRGPQTQAADIF